jgi:Mrp family chromosome partitioning ATPase
MSRNFELLREAGWGQEFFQGLPSGIRTADAKPRRPKLPHLGNDQISKLVQKVFLDPRSPHIRSVMFTSNTRRVGCTWTCAQVAKLLSASVEASVCVVDANFQAPSLQQHFLLEAKAGFSDAIVESKPAKDFAKQLNGGNLWIVPAGHQTTRTQLVSKEPFLEMRLEELRGAFDYLLVDAPLVAPGSKQIATRRTVDGVVLVLESNSIGAKSVLEIRRRLDKAYVPLLGVVLNQRGEVLPSVLDRLFR